MDYGDPRLPERFWEKVYPEPNTGCWLWSAAERRGYGQFSVRRIYPCYAHRLICHIAHGEPPDGKPYALHSCDVPLCVNPDHLRWGSQADNIQDAFRRKRLRWQHQTHCLHGHEYTKENTMLGGQGQRVCRICARESKRRWRKRQRAKREQGNT